MSFRFALNESIPKHFESSWDIMTTSNIMTSWCCRYAFTVASNIYVFVAFTILLSVTGGASSDDIGPDQMNTFLVSLLLHDNTTQWQHNET